MIQKIKFVPRAVAEKIAYTSNQAIISIGDPVQEAPNWLGSPKSVLELNFLDVVPGDSFGEEFGFQEEDAFKIIDYVRNLHPDVTELIVHCQAGISRSAAIALYAQAATNAKLDRHEFADLANTFVVEMLSHASGIDITIPPMAINPSWDSAWKL